MQTPLRFLVLALVFWLYSPVTALSQRNPSMATPSHVDVQSLHFDHLWPEDGLSSEQVLAIRQDRQGFMWFGTTDGLNRYDGYRFTVYQHVPIDTTSLAGDIVYAIFEDREGSLWIGTNGGLNRRDRRAGTFKRYLPDQAFPDVPWANDVGSIYEDRHGDLWIGTFGGGLYQLDRAADTLTAYTYDPDDPASLSGYVVEAMHEDRNGALWIGTNNGLSRFDRATKTFTRYLHALENPGDALIVDFIEDPHEDGVFWLTTVNGLSRFVQATGAFERFVTYPDPLPQTTGAWWSMPQGIVQDPAAPHVLWVAVPLAGLCRFDTQSSQAVWQRPDPHVQHALADGPHAVLKDRTGVIWAGTRRGVSRFDPTARGFGHVHHIPNDANSLLRRHVTALYEDRAGELWIGTGDFLEGTVLSRLDRRTDTFTHYRHDPDDPHSLRHNIGINVLYEDRAGTLWIGTDRGDTPDGTLSRLDRQTGTFTHLQHDPKDPRSLGPGAVTQLLEDRDGVLWVGTSSGLSRMDRAAGTFTRYRHDPKDASSLAGREVRALLQDHSGVLWVGTDSGLSRFDPTANAFVSYRHDVEDPSSLSSSSVYALYERASEPGVLWVGTEAALDRFDTRTGTVTHVNDVHPFPDFPVVGMLEDESGRLWMSTSGAGLLCFDPTTGLLQQYDEERGVQARRFNLGAAFKNARGEMFFGGPNGFNVFTPRDMQGNRVPPAVVLTDFKLFGESGPVGKEGVLQRPLAETEEIRLSHAQNVLAFEFAALHYRHPARNRYAYKLDGFDKNWIQAGTQRTATYTNLDPGTYTFRVKAANSDGVWNEADAAVRLTILPPWWRTFWAYGLYGLLLAGGGYLFDRRQRRRFLRKALAEARLRENKLRAEAAEAWSNYLQAENERQTQELEQARQLQLSMLPKKVPRHPSVELAAHMQTATEVGGDYYDFDVAEDGTLTFVVGDATGHGARAGTMVTAVKSLFTHCAQEEDIVQVLREITQTLKRMHLPKLYMALAMGRLRGQTLELAGAGMPPALVYHAATGRIERISLKGMPLGSFVDFPYQKTETTLEPGDTVVLMSDGFPELFNRSREMLGYEQVVKVFEEIAHTAPEAIIDHFRTAVSDWISGRAHDDDVTFVVLRMRPVLAAHSAAAPRRAAPAALHS